ncbi:12516_t:CDS:1 [Acaulospora morrowiae]|uniref:12516_t:CDS:1 n=1 Tax=Acaulospora morrowiae TaxID=94023 RepID=A0A9N8VEM0_9GLOM|nr:12516_t:CDS:1 [Acaulospora morrowiae]
MLLVTILPISNALPIHSHTEPSRLHKRGVAKFDTSIFERVNRERRSLSASGSDFALYMATYNFQNDKDHVKRNSADSLLHKALKRDVDLDEIDWDDNQI